MKVASLELCSKLYELSGWEYSVVYTCDNQHPEADVYHPNGHGGAYDLGYLLRKLSAVDDPDLKEPKNIYVELTVLDSYASATALRGRTDVSVDQPHQRTLPSCDADTPEDAAAKLAIELFREGILNPVSNPVSTSAP